MIDHQNTIIVIPARMASKRLPGKPMADIHGKPMIVHVWKRAVEANLGHVLVAAGELSIAEAVRAAGGDAIVTPVNLPSATERVAAALELRDSKGQYQNVVNLEGKLPLVDAMTLQRCLAGLTNPQVDVSTLAAEIHTEDERHDPETIKVIVPLGPEREVAFARDFVRVLTAEHVSPFWRHVGITAYRRDALDRLVKLPPSAREKQRSLEQMRALDNGMKIAVVRIDSIPHAVDTAQDLEKARQLLKDKS